MDIDLLPPSILAYIGDSVYELKARSWLLEQGYLSLKDIHQETVKLVNASAQARALKEIKGILTHEEADIVRKGRNSKTGSVPRNATITDYLLSTGIEALFGYHYLRGNEERLTEIWDELVAKLQ